MIGGFGKIYIDTINKIHANKNLEKKSLKSFSTLNNDKLSRLRIKLGPYLAGLVESDGSIAVHDKGSKAKPYNPKILIVFNINDKPLADKLCSITECGKVYHKRDAGYVIWHIQNIEHMLKMVFMINGYMRTPKIEALHRAIVWFNSLRGENFDLLSIDESDITSNAWLAGFTDGDGNFSINLTDRKKKGKITSKRVQAFFRIELRQTYHRISDENKMAASYFFILNKIASYLEVNLYSRCRVQGDKKFYAFIVTSHSASSHDKVINYFNRFSLYSSKHLAYKDWCTVVNLIKSRNRSVLTGEEISIVKNIKSQFNSKRTNFNFSHLDDLNV